jgi:hypothetical protein
MFLLFGLMTTAHGHALVITRLQNRGIFGMVSYGRFENMRRNVKRDLITIRPDRKPRVRRCPNDGQILVTRRERDVGLCSACIARREAEKGVRK